MKTFTKRKRNGQTARHAPRPAKPENANARMPAVTNAIDGPWKLRGIRDSSRRSRTLANKTNAKAKPTADALQNTVDLNIAPLKASSVAQMIAEPSTAQFVVISGR